MTDEAQDDTQQIEALLLQVLEAPEPQQGVALDAACPNAPALAARLRRRLQDLSQFGPVAKAPEQPLAHYPTASVPTVCSVRSAAAAWASSTSPSTSSCAAAWR